MIPTISGKPLSDTFHATLTRILKAANISGCYVDSVARTVPQQAMAMLVNLKRTGVEEQLGIYKEPGKAVIRVFNPHASDADNLAAMEAKILEVGPGNVSHHCVPADSPIEVADIAQDSILNSQHKAFIDAAKADPAYSLLLMENAVFHLEVKKVVPGVQS